MRKLWLDDNRNPPEGWDWAKNYKEFVEYIDKNPMPVVISFDHDLAFEHYPFSEINPTERIDYDAFKEMTGYDCAKYLVQINKFPERVIVHSYNPVGAQNIMNLLQPFTHVMRRLFSGVED